MNYMTVLLLFALCLCVSCVVTTQPREELGPKPLAEIQKKSRLFNSQVILPEFERSADEIRESVDESIQAANKKLDAVAALTPETVTFENTVQALDDISFETELVANRVYLIKETSLSPEMREVATAQIKAIQDWAIQVRYREDVYRAVKAYADTNPKLFGEDAKLLEDTMRDYRRDGLHLPEDQRAEIEELKKQLARLSTDFSTHITNARKALTFTAAELEGVPESFLNSPGVKTGEDEYTVMANVTWHFITVMENAKNEETRRQLQEARYTLAKEENADLLNQIISLRNTIAKKLGYQSWADYQIEPRMAKTGKTARDFLTRLKDGLEPKFQAELDEFRQLKIQETDDPDAQIHLWDWRYYRNQLMKDRYTVDTEQLRVFFPYHKVLEGMFAIYEHIFELKIERINVPYIWANGVEAYAVSDADLGEPLGVFYLDMFPREGKYNHFAEFGIVPGKKLSDGTYRRPVVALICNFPTPGADKPSLLTHNEVETLFHEFGHALHAILTRAKYDRFSGTSVPRDFVEAPSQMLENWVWDKKVLDSFAADYRDPSRKIPQEILDRMEAARLATIGTFYRRQLAFGLLDLYLHRDRPEGAPVNAVAESNQILNEVFLPVPEDSTFVTYFGHLNGYDAGYYGYAWADAIAADMNTVFENAPDRYFDAPTGMRLRDEIYEPGGSRDVNVSIKDFLQRDWSIDPFLKSIGIEK